MGDIMKPVEFGKLLNWIYTEYKENGTIFGIGKASFFYPAKREKYYTGEESYSIPLGIAAGPHSQCAQNIVCGYLCGARIFELKTVQVIDDLNLAKPCIEAKYEGYNTEWSTELKIHEAYEEYVKAWLLLHFLQRYLQLNTWEEKDFVFNMSVGYDLAGIKSPKIDRFINNLKDAGQDKYFCQCREELKNFVCDRADLQEYKEITRGISSKICQTITLSTMHGCPPDEQTAIVHHLIKTKNLHTYLKLNPTLLGREFVKNCLAATGYGIELKDKTFALDLQYSQAVAMLKKLQQTADEAGRIFGMKLSNTLPVVNNQDKLPGDEMYMSGKALYALTVNLAAKLQAEFGGRINISYCGGADSENIQKLWEAGIKPITVTTTLLKPGGYARLKQLAQIWQNSIIPEKIDQTLLEQTADKALKIRASRWRGSRKTSHKLPVYDCALAACQTGCPIHQNIPEYIRLCSQHKYSEALRVIHEQNALPGITGSICYEFCRPYCSRADYEEAVSIREIKLLALKLGLADYQKSIKPVKATGYKVAVIGAGPAGLSAGLQLRRAGCQVTVYEKEASGGGLVRKVISGDRLPEEVIESDLGLCLASGIEIEYNKPVQALELTKNFDYVIIAAGEAGGKKILRDSGLEKGPDNNTSHNQILIAGDARRGRTSVVQALQDGIQAATKILKADTGRIKAKKVNPQQLMSIETQRGTLQKRRENLLEECERCMHCDLECNKCVEVCPNRANLAIRTGSRIFDNAFQIVHIDWLCNECGNCETYCPWQGKPYEDKFTLFARGAELRTRGKTAMSFLSRDRGLIKENEIIYNFVIENNKLLVRPDKDRELSAQTKELAEIIATKYEYIWS